MPRLPLAALSASLLALTACDFLGGGTTAPSTADQAAARPERRSEARASDRPFVVNWSPMDRTALETRASEGAVVVRWQGEAIELLRRCRAPGSYAFVGSSHASQALEIGDRVELGLRLPFAGPVNLGGMLERYGRLVIEYHSVGELRLDRDAVHADELEGDCKGATHLVTGLGVGAFEFFAGEELGGEVDASAAGVGGVGAGAGRSHELLDRGGNKQACAEASKRNAEPPDGCDAVLAIELAAIERDFPLATGQRWEGHYECQGRKASARVEIAGVDERGASGTLSFDYGQDHGAWQFAGTLDPDTGELRLEFVEWIEQPSDYVPITPAGRFSPDQREFSGTIVEEVCNEFSFVLRD